MQDHPSQTSQPPALPTAQLTGSFDLFTPSWKAFKLNCWTFVLGVIIPFGLLIVPVVIALAGAGINNSTSDGTYSTNTAAGFNIATIVIGFVALVFLTLFFLPYMYVLKLQSAKGIKMGFRSTIKQSKPLIWRVLGVYICRGLVILAGTCLLIVPGFYMWRRYMLAPFYVVDQNCGVFEAMKKCSAETKPFSGAIWGMIGVYLVIELAGIIPLLGYLLGPVLAVIYCCAQALRYIEIKKATV